MALRKKEAIDRRTREKKQAQEEERRLREAEELAAKEAEEKAAREEKKKAEFAELKAIREKERQEALEAAALQERRAQEAFARRKAEKEAVSSAPRTMERPMDRTDSGERAPPRIALAGGKPSWRDKEAARQAGGDAAPSRPAPERAPERAPAPERADSTDRPTASGPPRLALQGKDGKAPTWREREAARLASGEAPPARSASGGVPLDRGRSRRDEDPKPTPPTETLKPSGGSGKYVPKHMR